MTSTGLFHGHVARKEPATTERGAIKATAYDENNTSMSGKMAKTTAFVFISSRHACSLVLFNYTCSTGTAKELLVPCTFPCTPFFINFNSAKENEERKSLRDERDKERNDSL